MRRWSDDAECFAFSARHGVTEVLGLVELRGILHE